MKMLVLVKREFQEQRLSFLYLPVLVATFIAFIFIVNLTRMYISDTDFITGNSLDAVISPGDLEGLDNMQTGSLERFASLPLDTRTALLNSLFRQISAPLLLVLWIAVAFYLLLTLYQEKKDRSILFWKSLPVSDIETVFAKLAAGLLLAPAIYLACLMVLHIVVLLAISLFALASEVDVWSTMVAPANLFSRWLLFLPLLLLSALWCLPVHAWLLLASSWSNSAPFAWAAGLPVVLVGIEILYLDTTEIVRFIGQHAIPVRILLIDGTEYFGAVRELLGMELLASTVFGCLFLYAAIVLRTRSADI